MACSRYSGSARLYVTRHLGEGDGRDLATLLEIPPHEVAAWPPGRTADAVWAWLDRRNRLDRLEVGLREIGRTDLAGRLERDRTRPRRRVASYWPDRTAGRPWLIVAGGLLMVAVAAAALASSRSVPRVLSTVCADRATITGIAGDGSGADAVAWSAPCPAPAAKQLRLVREFLDVGNPGTDPHSEFYLSPDLPADTTGVYRYPATCSHYDYRYFVISLGTGDEAKLIAAVGSDRDRGGRIDLDGFWGGTVPEEIRSMTVSGYSSRRRGTC
jgi:hypothetical protein